MYPRESRRYYWLLASVLGLTVLGPLSEHFILGRFLVGFLAIVTLATSVLAANASKKSSILVLVLAVVILLVWAFSLFSHELNLYPQAILTAAYTLTLVFVIVIGWIMMRDIFSNQVNGNRVAGAICVYFLGGFFFAILHMMILLCDVQAYKDNSSDSLTTTRGEVIAQTVYPLFVYYSFCTLSTAGFGDIVPVSRTARTMSWLEAISGQIYLTVLVARLVGLHIASSTSGASPSASERKPQGL